MGGHYGLQPVIMSVGALIHEIQGGTMKGDHSSSLMNGNQKSGDIAETNKNLGIASQQLEIKFGQKPDSTGPTTQGHNRRYRLISEKLMQIFQPPLVGTGITAVTLEGVAAHLVLEPQTFEPA